MGDAFYMPCPCNVERPDWNRGANKRKTAGLSVLDGLKLQMPKPGTKAEEKDEWIIVLGASGTVGQFAIQVSRVAKAASAVERDTKQVM